MMRSRRRSRNHTSRRFSISSTSGSPAPARSSIATMRGAAPSSSRASVSIRSSRLRLTRAARGPGARAAAAGRALHRRVRDEQVVERLQLVSGELPEPDPGEHGSADLHRPRHRPGLPRGLSGASRVQRAARAAPREGARMDRVHGLSAILAAIADCRRHGQLRHRGGLSWRRAGTIRAVRSLPARRPRRLARTGVLRRSGTGGSPVVRRKRSRAQVPERGDLDATRRPSGSSSTR